MNNNTKIRLHLSKVLFESITKQVIKENNNMGGGAYTEAVKASKAKKTPTMEEMSSKEKMKKGLYSKKSATNSMEEMSSKEKMKKGLYKEEMDDKDGLVQISLEEDLGGQEGLIELGKWAVKNYPEISKALGDTSLYDLGGTIVGIATVGTFVVALGLAAAKDSIIDAAKKVRNLIRGKKGEMDKSSSDDELANIVASLPEKDLEGK